MVIPSLAGKLDGISQRIPVSAGSLTELVAVVEGKVSKEEIDRAMKDEMTESFGYTEEQIKEILQRKADESSFSFELNSRPIFKDGKSEGNLRIANPPYNKYSIKVEIKLDDSGKIVFKSGEILPNHYIEYAKLTKRLKAGEYNATATINAYDTESGEYKGTSAAKLIIRVES